jgi:polar amino acid transport system substrate-binding protein
MSLGASVSLAWAPVLGARGLDGNWGAEHMAIAVPKGSEAAQALLDSFVSELQSSGQLHQIEIVAGLKGAVNAAKE